MSETTTAGGGDSLAGNVTHKRAMARFTSADNDAAALALRRAGAGYAQIAREQGVSKPTAFKRVQRALSRSVAEDADAVRSLEAERLDALQLAHWRRAIAGDTDATTAILRIMERRAKFLGLDTPVEYVLRLENDQVDFMETTIRRVVGAIAGVLSTNGGADLVHALWDTIEGEIIPREIAAAAGLAASGPPQED